MWGVDQQVNAWQLPFKRAQRAERGASQIGDVIGARCRLVYLNGKPCGSAGRIDCRPYRVPAGNVSAMGDRHDDGYDSCFLGPLPAERIYGRALKVILSLDRIVPRTDRPWIDFDAPQ